MSRSQILDDYKNLIRIVEGVAEVAAMTALYYLVLTRVYSRPDTGSEYTSIGVYFALTVVIFRMSDCFKFGHIKYIDCFAGQIIGILICNFLTYFQLCAVYRGMIDGIPMLQLSAAETALSFVCCYCYTRIYHNLYVPHDMLLVYGNESALDLKLKMDARADRYAITEVISIMRGQEAVAEALTRHDAVIINDIAGIKRNDLLKYCYEHRIRTYLVPKVSDIVIGGGQDITLFDTPLKLIKGRGLSLPQRFAKRAMDIVLCCIALIPGLPLMLLIALAIKLDDRGPVFYRQKRVTLNGKVFDILKFRSMVVNAEAGGYDLSMRANGRDPRITRVGAVIRTTRLDELPQILNILAGDMSIVGPRPERVENVEEYAREIPEWHLREKVKGGLTGYAQIYGRYNTSPIDKVKLDIMYIENYSVLLDLKLILMTVRILFSKESTEGFDAVEEREQARKRMIEELERNEQCPK